MSHPEKVRDRVRVIDERLARLRAEKDRLIARATQTERRRETRRKIVIGGTVLAALDREGIPAIRTRAEFLRWLASPEPRLALGSGPRRFEWAKA